MFKKIYSALCAAIVSVFMGISCFAEAAVGQSNPGTGVNVPWIPVVIAGGVLVAAGVVSVIIAVVKKSNKKNNNGEQ